MDLGQLIFAKNMIPQLSSADKAGVLEELINRLVETGEISDRDRILEAIWKREKLMSTGLQNGIATPHAKTDFTDEMKVAIGLKPRGIEFESLDGNPSTIFVLLLSPTAARGPHVQFLAEIAKRLKDEGARTKLLAAQSADEIAGFFI